MLNVLFLKNDINEKMYKVHNLSLGMYIYYITLGYVPMDHVPQIQPFNQNIYKNVWIIKNEEEK